MRLIGLCMVAVLLVGCGQSGKLVMPAGQAGSTQSPLARHSEIAGDPVTWVEKNDKANKQ